MLSMNKSKASIFLRIAASGAIASFIFTIITISNGSYLTLTSTADGGFRVIYGVVSFISAVCWLFGAIVIYALMRDNKATGYKLYGVGLFLSVVISAFSPIYLMLGTENMLPTLEDNEAEILAFIGIMLLILILLLAVFVIVFVSELMFFIGVSGGKLPLPKWSMFVTPFFSTIILFVLTMILTIPMSFAMAIRGEQNFSALSTSMLVQSVYSFISRLVLLAVLYVQNQRGKLFEEYQDWNVNSL